MIYIILLLVLFLFLSLLFLSVSMSTNKSHPLTILPEEELPTLNHRVEAIELCGNLLEECHQVIAYTKRGITTFQNTPLEDWQRVAEENVDTDSGMYWFVYRLDGVQPVQGLPYGYQEEDLSNLLDETGKNITSDIIETGKNGGGWVTYYWNIDLVRPEGTDELVKKKYSYVVPFTFGGETYSPKGGVSGLCSQATKPETYIIGTGIYLFNELQTIRDACQVQSTLEHCGPDVFSECQRVMMRVDTVKNLFQDYSVERALEILKENRAAFTNEEIYIYATDFNGTVLFNSLNPDAEGTNVGDHPCSQAALAHVLRCGGGWNICTFGDVVAQGFDIEATSCITCPYEERVIIGSSFNP